MMKNLKKYNVSLSELSYATIMVIAKDEEQAKRIAMHKRYSEDVDWEYNDTQIEEVIEVRKIT